MRHKQNIHSQLEQAQYSMIPVLATVVYLLAITTHALSVTNSTTNSTVPHGGLPATCKVPVGELPRVRKELRELTDLEREALFDAMWTMRNLTTDEGLAIYGGNFRNWDHYVVKHATAVQTPEGDQGHFGPCFMTFHRLLLLEVERTLLSIRPEFKALPYWDMTLDSAIGGRYALTDEDSIFSPKFFGSYTGNPEENYAVTDGSFAYWPVTKFNSTEYAPYADVYNGSETTGYNRKYTNPSNVSYVARFDKSGYVYPDPIMLLEDNTNICANYMFIKEWEQWQNCIEMVSSSKTSNPPYGIFYVNDVQATLPWFHAQAHLKIGSLQPDTKFLGDFMDVTTSINDPIFLFHHTNIDRNNMKWQMDAEAQNATMAADNVLWEFPTVLPDSNVSSTGFGINPGCWLQDSEVSYRFPFTPFQVFGKGSEVECPGSAPNGTYTHKDILKMTKPGLSTYVYDTNM